MNPNTNFLYESQTPVQRAKEAGPVKDQRQHIRQSNYS